MSSTGYLIWFIATAVMTVVVMGTCIAGASGVFTAEARARRRLQHEDERRLAVPQQRRASPEPTPAPQPARAPTAEATTGELTGGATDVAADMATGQTGSDLPR